MLYDKGWRGINIDITRSIEKDFAERRPRDINVLGLVGKFGEVSFHRFAEPALNTTDADCAERLVASGRKRKAIEHHVAKPLEEILAEHGVSGPIDLLSIDVEGADFEVLSSLDWSSRDVRAVLIEDSGEGHRSGSPIAEFLAQIGYTPATTFLRSVLYVRRQVA